MDITNCHNSWDVNLVKVKLNKIINIILKYPATENKDIVKILWHFIKYLDFLLLVNACKLR